MDNLEQALLESENSLMLLSDEELITPINDILIINPETRLIEVPNTELLLGVFSENLVEKKYFKCPRIVLNNIDLYECFIFINYVSASGREGYIQSKNVELDETEQYILFDWDLTNNVFDKNKDSTIYFSVSAKQYLEDSEPVFATRKAQGKMYETVNGTEHVTQEHADIILQILAGMKTKIDLPKDEDGNLLLPKEGQTLLFREDGTTYYGTINIEGGTSFSISAKDVTYDDTETEIGADNIQDVVGKLSATVNDLKEDVENIEIPVGGELKSGIRLGLPKRYELVEGDRFELFYKGIINAVYPEILFPAITSIANGFPSSMYSRKFVYTPQGNINKNAKYRFDLYDNDKNLLDSQETYLLARPKATNPTEEKVVLYVSDSLANFGNVPDEFYQRVQKDGLTNVKFIGTQKSQDNSVPYEGYGGWTFGSYADTSTSSAEMYITTNHDKTNDDKHGIYKDSNGTQWRLEDIGTNTIKITRYSGATELPTTGTLTWVSGGVNTSNIVYTNSRVGSSNPFCIGGKVDFGAYADSQGVEKIDYIYVLLGWNTFGKNEAYTKQKVMEFCNNVWTSFPKCRIVLLGLQIPARDGCGLQYGANESGNYQKRIQYVFDINNWYEELAESYSEYLLSFVNIAGQFDSEYNLITEEIEVNARNPLKETIQSDGLHPSTYGHYQIADACYRDLHHKLQEETVSLTQNLTGVVSSTHSDKVLLNKPTEIVLSGGNSDGTGWVVKDEDIAVTMNGENQTTENGVFSTDSVTGDIVIEATASEFVPYETAFVELSVPAKYKLTPVSWTVENPPTYAKVDNNPDYAVIDNNYANREILITINDEGITVYKEKVNEWIGEFTKFYEGAKKIYLTQGYVPHGTTTYKVTVVENGDSGEEEPDTPVEPTVTLTSISATYNGGNVLVGTSVNALTGITVTGHYSDGSTKTLTGYTLSGTIADGSNTITISYGGKTTTITVIGYVEESDEPVEIGTIYVEEGRYDYGGNVDSTIDTEVGSVSGGYTTTAIPVKVGDVINCVFGSTYAQFAPYGEAYNYLATNNRIIEYNSDGTYSKYAYAPEYPWTSDINGYVRIAYTQSYACALTGITLNGVELEVVNNTESSQPYIEEEGGEDDVTFPFETTKVKLSGNGTYYLTPIAYTNANPTFLVSTPTKSEGFPETHDTNEAKKLHKITIDDGGITVYTPKYNQYYEEKTSTFEGATEILFGAGKWGGYDIRQEANECVVTYRVDTDETQWGVGIIVETA